MPVTIMFLSLVLLAHVEQAAAEQEKYGFEDDWEIRTAEVNEGELRILASKVDAVEHHHHNRLTISQDSLETGWVEMYQCHTNLDVTPALQIVFTAERVRHLQIVSHKKIAKVWVENNTVQLEEISPASRICLSLQTRALINEGGKVTLKNGPFMRRFLDGYYPMRVSMNIQYPADELRFLDLKPVGINSLVKSINQLKFDVRFEGRLNTEVYFRRLQFKN